jgi:nucleoside-diphosphate-sugar epimerase
MAFARLIECAVGGGVFELWGDGEQTRDCTYVGDVVTAMRDAATSDWLGVANVGGGMQVSMNEVVRLTSWICGPVKVVRRSPSPGDVQHTGADTRVAASAFGYEPKATLAEGLRAMVDWERSRAVAA